MARQSSSVNPSPLSTAKSHISSKSLRSRMDSTESGAPGGSRSRAVTANRGAPSTVPSSRSNFSSRPNLAMDQSSAVAGMVVCKRTLIVRLISKVPCQHGRSDNTGIRTLASQIYEILTQQDTHHLVRCLHRAGPRLAGTRECGLVQILQILQRILNVRAVFRRVGFSPCVKILQYML